MVVSDDLPPSCTKEVKIRRKQRVTRKELDELITAATRAAHVARDKGFHVVSPEAIRCVKILRQIRSMHLTPRLITNTDAFHTFLFLSKNGNPKIRSESKSVVDHLKSILANKVK